jgi:hypothetical protein
MSPTIRIDEDVYQALQRRAEPFVDTPNSVLRRLLDLGVSESSGSGSDASDQPAASEYERTAPGRRKSQGTKKKAKRTRAPSGTLLSQDEYELPLLETLSQLGGSAAAGEAIERLGERLNGKLKPADYEKLDSGAIRWENRAQFVRYELVQRGDMKDDSPRGVWEISQQGLDRLSKESAA